MKVNLPSSVKAAYIAAIVAAALVGCCALYSGVGVIGQFFVQRTLGELGATGGAQGGDPALTQMLALQRTLAVVTFALMIIQLIASGSLAVGGSLGLSGRAIGRTFTIAAFAGFGVTTLIELGAGVWTWSQAQAMMGSIDAGAMNRGSSVSDQMQMMTALGLIPSACWALFKITVAAVGAAALLSPEARAHYAQFGEAEPSLGPRG